MEKKTYDLGWGESVAVRKAFIEVLPPTFPYVIGTSALNECGYPKHEGDPELVSITRKIIKRQIGNEYKHVFITNGATGGVNIALRAYRQKGFTTCKVHKPPYFRLYPSMIESSGLNLLHAENEVTQWHTAVNLIDVPSNPEGSFDTHGFHIFNPTIWDSVYFSRVYCPGKHPQPKHDVLVGSYSKFTGINGLRIGWIATNDDLLAERLKVLVTAEYCGVSAISTKTILQTAGKLTVKDWEKFEKKASGYLNNNREEFSKLLKYFGNKPIPEVGMFYYAPIDKHAKKLLDKSGIIWSTGSNLYDTDDFGRFNVGQDRTLIKDAVKEILKNDKI